MSTYKRTPEIIRKSKITQIKKILGEDCFGEPDNIIDYKFQIASKIKSQKAKITEVENNGFDTENTSFNDIEKIFSEIRRTHQNQVSKKEKKIRAKKRMITTLENLGVVTKNLSIEEISQHWSNLQKNNSIERMKNTLKNYGLYKSNMSDKDIRSGYSKFISSLQFNRSEEKKKQTSQKMIDRHKKRTKKEKKRIKDKRKKTNLLRYGCENVMQSSKIIERSIKKSKSYRDYIMPSGKIVRIQGYEDLILDFLLKNNLTNEENITVRKDQMPKIWYDDAKKQSHRYYPDIYLKAQNLLIEVKSDFLFQKDKSFILLKGNACKNLGFDFRLVILQNRKSQIELEI